MLVVDPTPHVTGTVATDTQGGSIPGSRTLSLAPKLNNALMVGSDDTAALTSAGGYPAEITLPPSACCWTCWTTSVYRRKNKNATKDTRVAEWWFKAREGAYNTYMTRAVARKKLCPWLNSLRRHLGCFWCLHLKSALGSRIIQKNQKKKWLRQLLRIASYWLRPWWLMNSWND